MKRIDLGKLEPDPVAAAFVTSDKDVIAIRGFVCTADERAIGIAPVRGSSTYTEYPRSAVVSGFSEEEEGPDRVTLLVDAQARVRTVTIGRQIGGDGAGCAISCKSMDGLASCCCGQGQRCRSLASTCVCEDASRPAFPVAVGGAGMPTGMPGGMPGGAAPPGGAFGQAAAAREINWYCRSERGLCPIVCYPIIVEGRVVDWWCYCDCSRPIPESSGQL